VERLQRKFALIHATLAQQTAMGSTPNKAADFAERLSLMSLAESASITAMGARMKASGRSVLALHRACGGSLNMCACCW
jgi:hypothetical protein